MRRTDSGTVARAGRQADWRTGGRTDVTCIDAAAAVAEFISCSARVCENFNLKFDPRNAEQALDKPDREGGVWNKGEEGSLSGCK